MDNDNKKSINVQEGKSVVNDSEPSYPSFTPNKANNMMGRYLKTTQVAKIIGVTKQTVIYWRKQGWFTADLVDHNGVYYYIPERVEQLKAVYRRDWQTAWRGEPAPDSEEIQGGNSEVTASEPNYPSVTPNETPAVFAYVEKTQPNWRQLTEPTKTLLMADYFAHQLKADIAALQNYATRKTGFDNIDEQQFFSPGLYVIGATPAAGKTTFCWQLLEQLAERGETCIYCSYEMSGLELFTKTASRKLFLKDKTNSLTAADIRRGSWSAQLDSVINEVANSQSNLQIMELQDENIDELLCRLKSHCSDKAKAPVVCLDYLQIVPTGRESAKLGIDDSVRKLKKFQRDTNTTFIVISSFNRTNYTQSVSFESFKESGNIEYTADVVWALQLFVLNSINPSNIGDSRKKIDEAKKKQPRQIHLKCLKNRQGTNYDCFFNYHCAHDYFEPCEQFSENKRTSSESKQ